MALTLDGLQRSASRSWGFLTVTGLTLAIAYGATRQDEYASNGNRFERSTSSLLRVRALQLENAADRLETQTAVQREIRDLPSGFTGLRAWRRGPFAVDPARYARAGYSDLWRRLGPERSLIPVLVMASTAKSDALAGGFAIMPWGTDGRSCVILDPTLATKAPAFRARAAAELRQNALGICASIARFGVPGAGMREWLIRSQYAALSASPLFVSPEVESVDERSMPERVVKSVVGLREDVVARRANRLRIIVASCAVGEERSCDTVVEQLDSLASQGPLGHAIYSLPTDASETVGAIGIGTEAFFARTQRRLGDARFAALWATDSAVPATYAAIAGESLAHAIERSLQEDLIGVEWHRERPGLALLIPTVAALLLGFGFACFSARSRDVSL